jgi:hypothetical protein
MATKVAIEVDVKTGDASDEIISLREELEKVKQTQKEMGDQFKAGFEAAEKGAKNAGKGVKSLGNGIGSLLKSLGIVTVIVAAFNKLKDIFLSNQSVADGFGKVMLTVEIVMRKLIELALPLGEALFDAFNNPKQAISDFVDGIKNRAIAAVRYLAEIAGSAGKIIAGVVTFDWAQVAEGVGELGVKYEEAKEAVTGVVDSFKDGVKSFVETTKEAYNQADAITNLRNELIKLEAQQKLVQMTYQKEAEDQRQIRDDVRKTLAERIEANDKLGKILEEQSEAERVIFQKRLDLANAELAINKTSVEAQAAVAQAKGELADLDERINGQKSEQLTNQAALEKELFDIQQELAKVGRSERELELLELEQHYAALAEQARLAGDTETDIEGAKGEALAKLRKKFRDEDLKKEKELRDAKVKLQQSYLDATGGVLNSINQLVEASGNQSKEAVALQKTLAIAQIAIDTAKAIVGAIAQAQSVPYPGNLVAIATGVAAVVAGIASAVSTLNSANVPGGGSAPPPAAPQVATAPAIQQATAGTTELGGVEQAQLAPIQAYVVETEVTGNQNNVNQIESQATFGG